MTTVVRSSLLSLFIVGILFPASVSGFVLPIPIAAYGTTSSSVSGPLATSLSALPMESAVLMGEVLTEATTGGLPSFLTSFTDQGSNLAGIFFQASLLPYLLFIYFLSYRANRLPELTQWGFQFVLVFVLSTIPAGIVSKSVYQTSLANVDYLHGGAELLLTVANVFIVLGLQQTMAAADKGEAAGNDGNDIQQFSLTQGRLASGVAATFFVASIVIGGGSPSNIPTFLGGFGNLGADTVQDFSWVAHTEPINGLSIPTWAIHFSSVLEYVVAMNLVWKFASYAQNEKWKGLTWGMLPLHASGICACSYHFFYNPSSLQFLVTSQAGLTLLGNLTCMLAAFRVAVSNGWTLSELNPLPAARTSARGLVADGVAGMPLAQVPAANIPSIADLVSKLALATVVLSYGIKYGSLAIDLPFTENAVVATALILGIPGLTAYSFYNRPERLEDEDGGVLNFSFFSSNDGENSRPSLSMDDIKKYGVAGTVAYILTELAFWIVAFPVAAAALYKSTGHWPDVINDETERTAVLAFIFAGANIARAAVPLRFGAALALAPWVDDNIIARLDSGSSGGNAGPNDMDVTTDETAV